MSEELFALRLTVRAPMNTTLTATPMSIHEIAVRRADTGFGTGHLNECAGHADMIIVAVRVEYPTDVARFETEIVDVAEKNVAALGQPGIQQQQAVSGVKEIGGGTFTADVPKFAVELKRRQIFLPHLMNLHILPFSICC